MAGKQCKQQHTYFWEEPLPAKIRLSNALLIQRNEQIVVRYHYHTCIHGRSYAAATQLLTKEMHVSAETVGRVIDLYVEELKQLRAKGLTIDTLRAHFGHMNWQRPVRQDNRLYGQFSDETKAGSK